MQAQDGTGTNGAYQEDTASAPPTEVPTACSCGVLARLADTEKLEWLVYEIFYANPIAFARKNLVVGLQRYLRGEPLATPDEVQAKLLEAMSDEDRAAWHRANNARKLSVRGFDAVDLEPADV